jgi:hypothetical protein
LIDILKTIELNYRKIQPQKPEIINEIKAQELSFKVTFLGTGTSQGVPVIACNATCANLRIRRDNRLEPLFF